jgi:hypothetical protein
VSEFVKKRPGTPGLALASFFSSRASLRTNDVANGRRENGNADARAGFVIVRRIMRVAVWRIVECNSSRDGQG